MIQPEQLKFYLYLLDQNVADALKSARKVDFAVLARDIDQIFSELDRFLVQTSRVSRFFWPAQPSGCSPSERKRRQGQSDCRASALRQALNLGEESALKSRHLRNHLEHADERLDDWVLNSSRRNFADRNIGHFQSAISGLDVVDEFRHFDLTSYIFRYRGEEFDIAALVAGVKEVQRSLSAVSTSMAR